jgi:excisionase family DNA binding protein
VTQRLLTAREVADRLGLSPETVLRRWRAGELPGYRLRSNVLRFSEDDLDAWLEAQRCGERCFYVCQVIAGGFSSRR